MSASPIIVEKAQAAEIVNLSVSTLDKLQRNGGFPKPRKLSAGRVGYLISDLHKWAEALPVSDLLPPPNTGAPKPGRRRKTQDAQPVA